ncbi:pilus assembly protein N-terminal domain-containing protein [Bacteroides sp. 1001136B_160425_E2]|uniref:pilus assembly protein N-terminal domain-containing protein n=1 Tax=Bacteroides sp. 1001136B_160425_E2 TaxID=2787083 RepID=UPI00189EF08A|nr:pilus assembly protein N-terminal domain-containing protein [Bacteroides sp. 1001136B_160425_E2]
MKAKTTRLCLLFILLCSLPVFYSCSDEADDFYLFEYWEVMLNPEPPISEASLSITGGTKLGIKGGVAPYTAEIADGQIATAYVDENNDIRISSLKLGSTALMVKDADGRIIKIGLKVVNGKQSFSVNSVEARIIGIDESLLNEQQKEKLEAVIEKIKDEADIQATGGIAFSYDQKSSGKVTIVTGKENTPEIEGSFSRSTSESGTTFQITINGKEYDCKFKLPERPDTSKSITTRDLGPIPYWLVEDVTEDYKSDVTGLFGINATSLKIERIYIGSFTPLR